ncbi:MAG: hypothetical protein GXP13_04495 [Gammaproteobacteria bacterium]|nr:hypothetical protein [Gammaproteobacteria bacterium]
MDNFSKLTRLVLILATLILASACSSSTSPQIASSNINNADNNNGNTNVLPDVEVLPDIIAFVPPVVVPNNPVDLSTSTPETVAEKTLKIIQGLIDINKSLLSFDFINQQRTLLLGHLGSLPLSIPTGSFQVDCSYIDINGITVSSGNYTVSYNIADLVNPASGDSIGVNYANCQQTEGNILSGSITGTITNVAQGICTDACFGLSLDFNQLKITGATNQTIALTHGTLNISADGKTFSGDYLYLLTQDAIELTNFIFNIANANGVITVKSTFDLASNMLGGKITVKTIEDLTYSNCEWISGNLQISTPAGIITITILGNSQISVTADIDGIPGEDPGYPVIIDISTGGISTGGGTSSGGGATGDGNSSDDDSSSDDGSSSGDDASDDGSSSGDDSSSDDDASSGDDSSSDDDASSGNDSSSDDDGSS